MRIPGSAAVYLIHQAVPFSSSDPFFKGAQHPLRPYRWFHPLPSGSGFSGVFSLWHWRRSFFLRSVRHASTFLRSLRSTSVTRLRRYYGRSDSCWLVLRPIHASALYRMNSSLPTNRSPRFSALAFLTIPSPTTRRAPRRRFLTLPLSSTGLRFRGPGFATRFAGSPSRLAESSSSSYGLVVRLLLLPTPSHDDAVTGGFGPESVYPKGTFTPLTIAPFGRANHRLQPPGGSAST